MDLTLKNMLERHPSSHLLYPDRINVLWSDGETRAGVYIPLKGAGFILAEQSDYHPMGIENWQEKYPEPPFETTGSQWLVNLNRMDYAEREIHYKEGAVQGLVYALEQITFGGPLEPELYQEFIVNSAAEIIEQAETNQAAWEELDEFISARLSALGFSNQAIEAQR